MTVVEGTAGARPSWRAGETWRRLFRERPIIPLLVLLGALVLLLQIVQPGTVNPNWVGSTLRFAVPLAILAACQTLTMLTGGIDLSVGMVASMAAYILATQVPTQGPLVAVLLALAACGAAGLANGIGVGVFRVHPLIMTLAMSLVVLGLMTVYQRIMVAAGSRVPAEVAWLGGGTSFGFLPNNLLLFVPLALGILWGLRRSGYGRLLYAVGDNEGAARLSGVRVWQVLLTLYVISAVLAGVAGLVYVGVTKVATVTLVDKFVLHVGGRRGHRRHLHLRWPRRLQREHRGCAHPDRAHEPPDRAPDARGRAPDRVRGDHPRGGRRVHPHHERVLTMAVARSSTAPGRGALHLGLDLGATNIKWAVLAREGEVWSTIATGQSPTGAEAGSDAVVGRLAAVASRAIEEHRAVTSLGVGVPGLYDPVSGTTEFLVNMPGGWHGVPIMAPLHRALGLPVALINDARAFGLAELRLGAARGVRSMIGMTLGTGIGGVVAIDGHILHGFKGRAGELGHQTIDPDGPWCNCGNRGCVEAYCRADQISLACGTATVEEAVAAARGR